MKRKLFTLKREDWRFATTSCAHIRVDTVIKRVQESLRTSIRFEHKKVNRAFHGSNQLVLGMCILYHLVVHSPSRPYANVEKKSSCSG